MTRVNFTYVVNILVRNQNNPRTSEWIKLNRILNYLKETSTLGLVYKGKGNRIECFVDASFALDKSDSKSTTGFLVKIFGDTIS